MAGTRKTTKKKDKPVKRKANLTKKKEVVTTLEGWSLGDFVWAKSAGNEFMQGTITNLHATDQIVNGENLGYAVTILTSEGKYKVGLLSSVSVNKPKGVRSRRAKAK